MTPLQHHFELIGWAEEKITIALLDRRRPRRAARLLTLPGRRGRVLERMPVTAAAGPIRTSDDLRGRRALVLGLARSGVAAARFLADAGAAVTVYDRRPAGELADAVAALDGRPVRLLLDVDHPALADAMAAADLLVTSPSISSHFPTTEPWLRDLLTEAERRRVRAGQRGRALPAPDAGADRGGHRHEGQDDDRLAARRHAPARRGCRASSAATSGHRSSSTPTR